MSPLEADGRGPLLARLDAERDHVLTAVDGLDDEQLRRVLVPSGWSVAHLLNHLSYDDEIFWVQAVVAGDREAIGQVRDGWRVPVTNGLQAVERYRAAVARSREVLAPTDLEAAPPGWPPPAVVPFPAFSSNEECVLRVLTETATHAGHLDIVRELIDGSQHLVVG